MQTHIGFNMAFPDVGALMTRTGAGVALYHETVPAPEKM
jgi:hypothetical protein